MNEEKKQFRKCAVVGAGTMGAGIAAHMACCGMDVVLLDLDAKLAADGVARQLKSGGFMMPDFAKQVTTGNIKTDLGLLQDCDWVVEAVAERIDIKRQLFSQIDAVRKPGCIVSSNTSTIPLAELVSEASPSLAGDMLITHFFNPPRHMRLLELVSGPRTKPDTTACMTHFLDNVLGKAVVPCKDTPGFIANRIGCYWLAAGLGEALKLGITPELADAVMGRAFGFPSTGMFGLWDLIGIDLMPGLIQSLQDALPSLDAIQVYEAEPDLVKTMLAQGLKGRKSGGGFYRQSTDRKTKETFDPTSRSWRPYEVQTLPYTDAAKLIASDTLAGRYAWAVMSRTLAYAAALVPEIADRPDQVDAAMRFGYAWKAGPFELMDRVGTASFASGLEKDGQAVPALLTAAGKTGFYDTANGQRTVLIPAEERPTRVPMEQPAGIISLANLRLRSIPVFQTEAASLWDIGEGVGLCEFHTPMNVFTPKLLESVRQIIAEVPKKFQALVVGNDGRVFSAGADLKAMLAMSEKNDKAGLAQFITDGVETFMALAAAPFPIVGAAGALTLGGGCEFMLHVTADALHAETSIGLVESRVGLLPGWGGVTRWLLRHHEAGLSPEEAAKQVFTGVLHGVAAPCGFAAKAQHLIRQTDQVVMNVDRLIATARNRAITLASGFTPATTPSVVLPPRTVLADLLKTRQDTLSPHDFVLGSMLVEILSGDGKTAVSLAEITTRVTDNFLDIALTGSTRARIAHMLDTGKPLKN
ncbi:3-hydroxyacyl-CoA dehydrogenase/enoyl-CoA hydratase family protein [Acetobacter senegalensis]|uniref:3-hydroxyacyl-CoA dehydrogenase/enoyl-CoA hydratase family protein n=1 Tax=Acetobacter senegalensis TaxID=446692 RepID=UPI002650CCFF|nr:3-hydroxyacyl-CoA dehydrogenase/enoyl-CoA hydratase family protein [Acetobacter senegalensis]MDN7351137.1 3-hydroxyacyl-CoA dehydrogenase NAD-binding domain-containing protein [Acetobacter senegalensis]